MRATLRRAGECGVLVELGDLDAVLSLDAIVRRLRDQGEKPWDALREVVPAATTLLLVTRSAEQHAPLMTALRQLVAAHGFAEGHLSGARGRSSGEVVEVPVEYSGPDLEEVGRLTGLTPAKVVAAHTGTPWQVAFSGFAPGFPYLVGGDPRLNVPRRSEPRTAVPAGAVGLAGHFSGIYPRESPGGWQLLGTTPLTLWDTDRTPPALLQPGMVVQFREA